MEDDNLKYPLHYTFMALMGVGLVLTLVVLWPLVVLVVVIADALLSVMF